jgi:hypothetical protein
MNRSRNRASRTLTLHNRFDPDRVIFLCKLTRVANLIYLPRVKPLDLEIRVWYQFCGPPIRRFCVL